MKHIKKLSALLMCALIALSACLTASADPNPAIKPTGDYTLKINLYESANQAIKENLGSLATNRGNGGETTPDSAFKKSTLAGVKFDIYPANSAKNGKEEGSTAKQVTTDAYGVATFTTKTPGTYWVKVNSLPKAVAACLDIKDGFAVDLPMTNPNGDGWLKTVNVYPKVDTVWGKATFKKVDEKGNAITSSSAKFTLYRTDITDAMITAAASSYNQLVATLSASTGITWTEYKTDITSGANGEFSTGRIPYGAYKLVETQAPTGYALNQTPRYFIIDGLEDTKNIENVDITGNTYTIGEVKIINKKLEGISKTLTSDSTASIGETVTWEIKGKVPSDWGTANYTEYKITDTLHEAFDYVNTTVKVGGAEVTDVAKIAGNTVTVNLKDKINASNADKDIVITITATLKPNAALLNGIKNTATLTYSNSGGSKTETAESGEVKTGGYTFKKVGSDTGDKGLAGAKFKVYKSSNNKQVTYFCTDAGLKNLAVDGIVESDANGFVHIYGLAYGDYYLVEVKAPKGYELNGENINFTITEATSDTSGKVDKTIYNEKKVELPFTGGVGAEVVVASGVVMMVAAGFVLKKRVK